MKITFELTEDIMSKIAARWPAAAAVLKARGVKTTRVVQNIRRFCFLFDELEGTLPEFDMYFDNGKACLISDGFCQEFLDGREPTTNLGHDIGPRSDVDIAIDAIVAECFNINTNIGCIRREYSWPTPELEAAASVLFPACIKFADAAAEYMQIRRERQA